MNRSVKAARAGEVGSVSVVRTVPGSPHPGDKAGSERISVCSEGGSIDVQTLRLGLDGVRVLKAFESALLLGVRCSGWQPICAVWERDSRLSR